MKAINTQWFGLAFYFLWLSFLCKCLCVSTHVCECPHRQKMCYRQVWAPQPESWNWTQVLCKSSWAVRLSEFGTLNYCQCTLSGMLFFVSLVPSVSYKGNGLIPWNVWYRTGDWAGSGNWFTYSADWAPLMWPVSVLLLSEVVCFALDFSEFLLFSCVSFDRLLSPWVALGRVLKIM